MDFDYERMSYGMTDKDLLAEGLVDPLDLPYDRRTDDDDHEDDDEDDSTYYGDVKDLDDEDEIRF